MKFGAPGTPPIVRCVTFWWVFSVPTAPGRCDWEEAGVVSVTETTKAALRAFFGNSLPLIGLGLAVIANVAWIGLLGYFVFKLV